MLALSRCEGQSIIIDGIIEVKVVKWSRNSVRLAIQAPREVSIDRDEIWKRIHPGEKSPLEKADLQRGEASLSPLALDTRMGSHHPSPRLDITSGDGALRAQPPTNGHDRNGSAAGTGI